MAALLACGPPDEQPGPPPVGMTGGTGPSSVTAAGGATQGGGGTDPACMPDPGGGGTTTTGLPKFDVGGTGGVDLPVACDDLDAARSNLGCVFWAVDLPNDWNGTDMSPPAADQPYAVVVANSSALVPANVSVYLGDGTTPIDTATVDVDETVTFVLEGGDLSPTVPGASGTAFRIESDVPVTAYQFNPLDNTNPVYSNDASLLLPEHVLGRDHAVLSGDGILLSMGADDPMPDPVGAFVAVVAAADGVRVTVEPSGPVLAGPLEDVLLDRGRVLTVLADSVAGDGNLSGSRVTADGHLFLCLYAKEGLDLRALVRGGATDDEIAQAISGAWAARDNAGAEERLALRERAPLAARRELEANPRLEMHKRGG